MLMMNSPGKVLQQEREKQGKSLKEISVRLKLSIEYLAAIEEDNFSDLPAEFFTKAYLRLYADELGIDADFVLDLFHKLGKEETPDEPALADETSPPLFLQVREFLFNVIRTGLTSVWSALSAIPTVFSKLKPSINIHIDVSSPRNDVKNFLFARKNMVIFIVLVFIVTAAIIGVLDKSEPERSVMSGDKVVPPKPSREGKKENVIIEKTAVQAEVKEPRRDKQALGNLKLNIIAQDLTWVSVRIDGEGPRETQLRAGDSLTLRAKEQFDLKIGNAGATTLVLNGREIKDLGPRGKVVNIVLP